MGQVSIEQYFERLNEYGSEYQWPKKSEHERREEREQVHKEFPYVITYSGNYGRGCLLDDMQDWCREQFGDEHGECCWTGCEWDWERWHEEVGLEDELDRKTWEGPHGPRPDSKDKKAWNKWQKINNKIIDEHFEMAEARLDAPGEHSHWGIWTTFYICKIGYDEAYQDYCFKNVEDAFYFKLMWDEEAERRG